jgi:hypothetical protein
MDTVVPVNADRYRGNVYTKLGLQFRKPSGELSQQPSSLVNVSTHLGHFNFMSRIAFNTRRFLTTKTQVTGLNWGSLSYLDESYLVRQNSFAVELTALKYADQIKRSYKKIVLKVLPTSPKDLVSLEKAFRKPVFKLGLFNSLFDQPSPTKPIGGRQNRKTKLVTALRSNTLLMSRYKRHEAVTSKRQAKLEKFT